MHPGDQPTRDNDAEIEEELGRDEAEVNFPRAMSGEPPNAEEKQEREDRLIAMENK